MKYSPEVQQDLEMARKTLQVWLDNDDGRIDCLNKVAEKLTLFRENPLAVMPGFNLGHDELHNLERAAYLSLALVRTIGLMVKDTTPPEPDHRLN